MSQSSCLLSLRWQGQISIHKSSNVVVYLRNGKSSYPTVQHRRLSRLSLASRQAELPNAQDATPRRKTTEHRIAFFDDKQPNSNILGSTMAEQTTNDAGSQAQIGANETHLTGGQTFRFWSRGDSSENSVPSYQQTKVSRFRTAVSELPVGATPVSKYQHSSFRPARSQDRQAEYDLHDGSTDPRAFETWNRPDIPLMPTREELARLEKIPSANAQRRRSWRPETGSSGETDESGEAKPRFKMRYSNSRIPDNIPRGRFKAIMRQGIVDAGGQAEMPHEALSYKVPGGNEIDALARRLEDLSVAQAGSRQRESGDNPNNDIDVWPPPWRKVDFSDKKDRAGVEPLPVPIPSEEYLAAARAEPILASAPKKLLVILDLNGTLFYKAPRTSKPSRTITRRPYLEEFLAYCLNEHKVLIWSSARTRTVSEAVDQIFTSQQRQRLVSLFSRNDLGLNHEQFHGNPQVYKRLETVWANNNVNKRHPDKKGATWSQKDTVLIDDSYLKAAKQPYNHMEVPEYYPGNSYDGKGKEILAQAEEYLEKARQYEDVSAYMYKHQFRAKYIKDYVEPVKGQKNPQRRDD